MLINQLATYNLKYTVFKNNIYVLHVHKVGLMHKRQDKYYDEVTDFEIVDIAGPIIQLNSVCHSFRLATKCLSL